METSKTTPKNKTPWLAISLVILLLSSTGLLSYKYYQATQELNQKKPATQITPSPSPKVIASPSPQQTVVQKPYTQSTSVPNQKKYTNPQFGLSFLYLTIDSYDNNTEFTTKEIGNKIYLYPQDNSYETGQYLEVFEKDPTQTLEDAIKTTFLEGYDPQKCLVSLEDSPQNYPTSYQKAIIKVPGEFTDMQEMSEKVRECPKTYTQFGGISYFLMDQKHPDKFLFFSIGQYAITADGNNLTWQDTISFLD